MRRGIHITISLLAILLLLKPFDCFSNGTFTRKAAECCKKGKCTPSTGADECCKGTIPGGKQLVASKASEHSAPAFYIVSADALGSVDLPIARVNLPLLI